MEFLISMGATGVSRWRVAAQAGVDTSSIAGGGDGRDHAVLGVDMGRAGRRGLDGGAGNMGRVVQVGFKTVSTVE